MVLAGCSFQEGTLLEPDSGGVGSDPTSDGGTTSRVCKYGHPSLRLCLEFDDGSVNPVYDASTARLNIESQNLEKLNGPRSPAAATVLNSTLHVPETQNLDVTTQATLEMWVGPAFDISSTLINNDSQYGMWLDDEQRVNCKFGNATVTSDTHAPLGYWSHVACTYDGTLVTAYVSTPTENTAKCANGSGSIPTGGWKGTWIAPSVALGIDDIHIYAAALSGAEICTHADVTCALACTPE